MEIPRRNRVDQYSPEEQSISAALQAVEKMPADIRLTHASTLLIAAQKRVADYIDGVESPDAQIAVPASFLKHLQDESDMLSALNAAGVDNWDGHSEAFKIMHRRKGQIGCEGCGEWKPKADFGEDADGNEVCGECRQLV